MLKKQVSPKIVAIVFGVIVVVFAIAVYVSAWTEPSAIPPGANVDAPLNVSNTPQQKAGALRLGGLTVDNDTYLATAGGNVGIGTTTPGAKLQVNGTVSIFGAWRTELTDQVYQAETDGFVIGWCAVNDGLNAVQGYTDQFNPPTTMRFASGVTIGTNSQMPIMFPVRKGDYWKVTGCSTSVFWLPLGN